MNQHFSRMEVVGETGSGFEAICSTEHRIRSWNKTRECWMDRILMHHPSLVDLSPVLTALVVHVKHNKFLRAAIIENLEIRDRQLVVKAKWADTPFARWTKREFDAGLLRSISIGYSSKQSFVVERGEVFEGIAGPCVVHTQWAVEELSLTTFPRNRHARVTNPKSPEKDLSPVLIEVARLGLIAGLTEAEVVKRMEAVSLETARAEFIAMLDVNRRYGWVPPGPEVTSTAVSPE